MKTDPPDASKDRARPNTGAQTRLTAPRLSQAARMTAAGGKNGAKKARPEPRLADGKTNGHQPQAPTWPQAVQNSHPSRLIRA